MNELFAMLGIESWKPTLTALVMPPVPFLLLVLAGARLMFRRRALAWLLVLTGCAGVWLMCTAAAGIGLTNLLLKPPPALGPAQIAELRRAPKTAVLVLGAGRYLLAPEYGVANLKPYTLERLRYGLWLARETGLPVGFSGGVGHGGDPGPSEADIASRVAEREFGRPLRWAEGQSRDTHENAVRSVALLHAAGIERIVLVTHAFHMRRALNNFSREMQRTGKPMALVAAPLGVRAPEPLEASDWLPTAEGFRATRIALHEWLGRLLGA
jgi:uncharacterized SAM-binding protein YcdF (DUF218 family)